MLLSNPAKIVLIFLLIFPAISGCSWIYSTASDDNAKAVESPRNFPFVKTEPKVYQCEIIERAGDSERKYFVAKKNSFRRIDFDFREPGERSIIETDREILLSRSTKTFAEKPILAGNTTLPKFDDLTEALLVKAGKMTFDEVERSGDLVTYEGQVADSTDNLYSIIFDESKGILVKQEQFVIEATNRRLVFSIEVRNFSTTVDDEVFKVPDGFSKVPFDQFLKHK